MADIYEDIIKSSQKTQILEPTLRDRAEFATLIEDITEGQIHLPDNYGMTSSRDLAQWLWDRGWRRKN